MPLSSRLDYRFLLPVFLFGLLVHAGTLDYWFVASDTLALIESSRVENLRDLLRLFTQPLMAGSDFLTTAVFYRPISSLSYALDYAVWGLNPFGYHLTNVLLHAIAAVLVALAIAELTDRPAVGILTAVLFVAHPVTMDVVPVTARRQDVLRTVFVLAALWLFVRWYRGWQRRTAESSRRLRPHRPLVGALFAYALALGAKETALLVPGLVVAWVILQQGVARPRRTVRTAISAVGPFVALTVLYVAVRTVALGGLGGYDTANADLPPYTPGNVALFAAKYVLWSVFPVGSLESLTSGLTAALTDVSPTTLAVLVLSPVVVMVGGTVLGALVRRGYLSRGPWRTARTFVPVGCIAGFAAVSLALASASGTEPVAEATPMLARYATGLLFVGGCGIAIVAAALVRNRPFDGAVRRQLLFFACWFAVPCGFLLVSRYVLNQPLSFGFAIQNAYGPVIPVLAALSLVVLTALGRARDAFRSEEVRLDANAVLVVFVAVLLVPTIAASPLVSANDGWGAAGELNRQSLHAVSDELDGAPDAGVVYIVGFPNGFDASSIPDPHARWVTPLRAYSIEAWLAMQDPPRDTEIRLVQSRTVGTVPDQLQFRTATADDIVIVRTETADADADDSAANRGIDAPQYASSRWRALHNAHVLAGRTIHQS